MQERHIWESGITLVTLGVVVGQCLVVLVRFTDLPFDPWGYVGLASGVLSAGAGALLAFIRSVEVSAG